MAELLFYRQIVAIDKDKHRDLRLGTIDDYSFAAKTNSIPLTAVEFFEAAREYPIVFGGDTAKGPIPAVLVGLRSDENIFIDKSGKWDRRYIPAFVRRYPFVLADVGDEQLVVCIDENHPAVGAKEGKALFNADGTQTDFLANAIKFMGDFQAETQRTREFMRRMTELDLLTEVSARAELRNGPSYQLGGFSVINEAKFRELDKDVVVELFRKGWLSLIDAHLLSLGNLGQVIDRMANAPLKAA